MTLETCTMLLRFAESIANSTSGNLHSFHSDVVRAARGAVKAAGGTLEPIGRYHAGEAEPMSFAEYDKVKAQRRAARVLEALQAGPAFSRLGNVYSSADERLTDTETAFENLVAALRRHGHRIRKTKDGGGTYWALDS